MNKPWKVMSTLAVASCLLLSTACTNNEQATNSKPTEKEKEVQAVRKENYEVRVSDYTYDNAANMFALTEFELSGEPLVEGLGVDLDTLDPGKINEPSAFDYTAAIEAYEYSEEAMIEVVEKSGLGLHLVHGPALKHWAKMKGLTPEEALSERYYELADSVGYPREEIFQNMFPTMIEYTKGDPHYPQEVNIDEYASNDDGTYVPVYQVDYKSVRWDRSKMEKQLNPSAYGATFLKQALWASDFLGGYHNTKTDEELEGNTPNDDQAEDVALGVSSADGMQGMILAEGIWNKLNFVADQLFMDEKNNKLTNIKPGTLYNPEEGFVYLPHKIEVMEDGNDVAPKASQLKVVDSKSYLQDQWLMLWSGSEYFGMTDQRPESKNVAPSFRAVFDGAPYPKAEQKNIDSTIENDVRSNDPYSVNRDVLLHVFKNIDAMHFNKEKGFFVTEHTGEQAGTYMDTFQAGYTMEALRIFQRAFDGMPVGYGSGEEGEALQTAEGKRAKELIIKQADFIMNELMKDHGLVANGFDVEKGVDTSEPTLKAQLGAIRGLTAAYLATKDEKYREAARKLYVKMDEYFLDKELNLYQTKKGEWKYDPYVAGALSAAFRVGIQNLSNTGNESEQPEALEIESITSKYVDFHEKIIDGPALDQGMITSEFWDTGDFYKAGDKSGNTDGDNVPQIQAGHGQYGIAPVLVPVELKKK
jgi:hypothetical protein